MYFITEPVPYLVCVREGGILSQSLYPTLSADARNMADTVSLLARSLVP